MAKKLAPCLILMLAFALRVIALDSVPPGWRDDEAIETTVHAQLVLDGHFPLYFIQAEGHEPIYHYATAGWIALVGRSLFNVRLVSVFFGTLAVAAAYRLTRQLFGTRTALLVALLFAVSFWALMYSRTKIRHISELPFVLLALSHLFAILQNPKPRVPNRKFIIQHSAFSLAFLVLALHAYLAATAVLISLVLLGLHLIITRHTPRHTKYVFAIWVFSILLYLPLAYQIRTVATRVDIVGGPLAELRAGNPQPLLGNVIGTLAMFGKAGDNEALYNIPGRPVFGFVGFYFFVAGVMIAFSRWRDPRYAFLLIWLLCGIAPAFASNPPGSLGHTITALPVAYILVTLPVFHLSLPKTQRQVVNLLGMLLFSAVALRDLPDYFWRWPSDSEVRYLYRADLHELAQKLRSAPPATYVLSGSLSKWDRVAFELEGLAFESPPRWVNAEWAIVFPAQPSHLLFDPSDWQLNSAPPEHPDSVRFTNDLTFQGWADWGREVIGYWRVGPAYAAVEPEAGSFIGSPSFPVFIFIHLLDPNGALVTGSDRFDVDTYTLQPGDQFLQRHLLDAPPGTYTLQIGLYNPITGERYLTDDGRDALIIGSINIP